MAFKRHGVNSISTHRPFFSLTRSFCPFTLLVTSLLWLHPDGPRHGMHTRTLQTSDRTRRGKQSAHLNPAAAVVRKSLRNQRGVFHCHSALIRHAHMCMDMKQGRSACCPSLQCAPLHRDSLKRCGYSIVRSSVCSGGTDQILCCCCLFPV